MTATFLGRVRDDWMGATGWGRLAWVVFALASFCSSSSWTALFQLVLHLPLCTHLSQIALTIAYPSIYSGFQSVLLACLDRILRSAARLIGQLPKFSHGTKCTCMMFCAGSLPHKV